MMIRIDRVLPRSKEQVPTTLWVHISTEPRGVLGPTDAKEQYCSEEVLLGVNFFQALVRECGVAWYGVTN